MDGHSVKHFANRDTVRLERSVASVYTTIHNFIWIWTMKCIILPSGWLFGCMLLGGNKWWGSHIFGTALRHELSESWLHLLVSSDGDMENDGSVNSHHPLPTMNNKLTSVSPGYFNTIIILYKTNMWILFWAKYPSDVISRIINHGQ